MKRFLATLLSALMVFGLVACGNTGSSGNASTGGASSGTGAAPTGTADRTPTMTAGFLLPTLQSEFFVVYSNGVTQALGDIGYAVTAASYDGEASKAIELVENFIVADVDLIIAMVSDGAVDNALKNAMDAGIKVMVSGSETAYYDVCMLADNADIGRMIGEIAADFVNEVHGGEAEVIAISVSAGNADMLERAQAMIAAFEEQCPNATIVGTPEYTNPGDATAGVENLLQQYPDVKVIMSFGDAGAIEGVQVMKAAGKTGDEYAAFGCDATEQALLMIAGGDMLRGTVDMGDIVSQTAEAAMALLAGELETPYRWIGSSVKVTAENIGDYVTG